MSKADSFYWCLVSKSKVFKGKTTRFLNKLIFSLTLIGALAIAPSSAFSQVVFSAGVQEVYDDNIYLEDNYTPLLTPPTGGSEPGSSPLNKQADGDINDDFITAVNFSVSSAYQKHRYLEGGGDIKFGGLFFADNNDEDRFTLDSFILMKPRAEVVPEWFLSTLSSRVSSETNDITAAQNTFTRQSQTHIGSLSLGAKDLPINNRTDFGLTYTLDRQDFLGAFTFDDPDEKAGALNPNIGDVDGSDYFRNSLDLQLTRHQTSALDIELSAGLSQYTYTSVDSNTYDYDDVSDLDRLDSMVSLGIRYQASQNFSFSGGAGVEGSNMTNSTRTLLITNPITGAITESVNENDDTVQLTYRGGFDYSLTSDGVLTGEARQSLGTDANGERLIVRTFSLNFSDHLSERFQLVLGGMFSQFDNGTSYSGATNRFEASSSINYWLTPSVAATVGYSYADQNADESDISLVGAREEYTTNRVFIGISGGLVGS